MLLKTKLSSVSLCNVDYQLWYSSKIYNLAVFTVNESTTFYNIFSHFTCVPVLCTPSQIRWSKFLMQKYLLVSSRFYSYVFYAITLTCYNLLCYMPNQTHTYLSLKIASQVNCYYASHYSVTYSVTFIKILY